MLIANVPGVGFLILGYAVGFGFQALSGSGDGIALLLMGLVTVAADLIYRWMNAQPGARTFISPRQGGHILFIPAWIIGALIVLMGVAAASEGPRPSTRSSSAGPALSSRLPRA